MVTGPPVLVTGISAPSPGPLAAVRAIPYPFPSVCPSERHPLYVTALQIVADLQIDPRGLDVGMPKDTGNDGHRYALVHEVHRQPVPEGMRVTVRWIDSSSPRKLADHAPSVLARPRPKPRPWLRVDDRHVQGKEPLQVGPEVDPAVLRRLFRTVGVRVLFLGFDSDALPLKVDVGPRHL